MLAARSRLHQAGDVAGAVAAYERVLALGVEDPALRSNLGAAYAASSGATTTRSTSTGARSPATQGTSRSAATSRSPTTRRAGWTDAAREARGRGARAARQRCRDAAARRLPVPPGAEPAASSSCCSRSLAARRRTGRSRTCSAWRSSAQGRMDGGAGGDRPRAARRLAGGARVPRDDVHARRRLREGASRRSARRSTANPKLPLVNFLNGQCLDGRDARATGRARSRRSAPSSRSTRTTSRRTSTSATCCARAPATTRRCRTSSARCGCGRTTSRAKFSLGAVYVALGRTEEALPLLEAGGSRRARPPPDAHAARGRVPPARAARPTRRASAQLVGKLQSEGENRFFRGVSDALGAPARADRTRSARRRPPAREAVGLRPDRGSSTARASRRRGSRCRCARR